MQKSPKYLQRFSKFRQMRIKTGHSPCECECACACFGVCVRVPCMCVSEYALSVCVRVCSYVCVRVCVCV